MLSYVTSWQSFVEALRKSTMLMGSVRNTDAIKCIVFTLPSGEKVSIPEDSPVEICYEQAQVLYAIGRQGLPGIADGEWGFTHGPTPSLGSMLAFEPPELESRIVRLGTDGAKIATHRPRSDCSALWQLV
jgi:hypothetical protein